MADARSMIETLGSCAEAMIGTLGAISAEPDRLVRLFLTPEHRRAADVTAQWMREAGMDVAEDALGTVRGGYRGEGAKHLLIGSHLDTVLDAGKYDGPFGVIAGILAVDHFARAGRRLPFGIHVLAFGDEEGSRFPSTLSTSAACVGAFDPATLALADRNGMSYADALEAYGKDARRIPEAAYSPAAAAGYLEVHIEQGPVLEKEDEPLGIVTGIVGQNRMRITVVGEAGHAGTTPMDLRRDALAGAAELILAAERIAQAHAADRMVATVGRIEALPGATNVIPGRVTFSIDLRSMTDAVRREAVQLLQAEAWRLVEARGLQIELAPLYEGTTTAMSPALQDLLAASVEGIGHKPIRLPSGAGHDAQMMAKLCPSAMLFVRCRGGISHNPAEYASPQDMGAAIAALIGFIERFRP